MKDVRLKGHGDLHEDSRELVKPGDVWRAQSFCKEGLTGHCVDLIQIPECWTCQDHGIYTEDSCRNEMECEQGKK